jgi:O-antigen/teichoic acid export membrane protein
LASIFQGFEDTAPNAIFNQIVNPGLFLLFVLLFLAFGLGFTFTLVAYVLSTGVAFALFVVYAYRRIPKLVPKPAGPKAPLPPGLFGLSVSLWGVTSFQFVTAYVDTIILGAITGNIAEVGLYSAAMTLARLLLVGNGALTYIYLPVAARLKREGDVETIRTSYVTATRWVLVITMPMLFLFLFLPVQSLHAVFGPNYTEGALALSILVIGSFASVIEGPANSALAGMGYARALLLTTVVAASVNLVLSLVLIPTYGLLGAAVAWAVSRAIYPGLGAYLLYQFDRVTPMRRLLVLPLAVSLAIGTPIFLAAAYFAVPSWTVIPFFFVGALVFIGAILLTRTVDRGDLTALSALERRVGRNFPGLHRFLERYVGPPMTPTGGPGG